MSQQQSTKAEQTVKPPYLSYKTLRNFLESLKASGVSGRIDRSIMPSSMSGANQVLVIAALKFLGLIDEVGIPQDNLHKIVELEKGERAQAYQQALKSAYSFLLKDLDIERATTRQVEERFKDIGLSTDTVRKAVNFFLLAAKDAELKVSPHIKPYQGTSGGQKTRKGTAKNGQTQQGNETSSSKGVSASQSTTKATYQVLIDILSPDMRDDEQDAVWTLIRYLKKKEAEQ